MRKSCRWLSQASIALVLPALSMGVNAENQTCANNLSSSNQANATLTSMSGGQLDLQYVADLQGSLIRRYGSPQQLNSMTADNMGAAVSTSTPAVASWGTGHAATFIRGTDGALWYRQNDNGSITDWQYLGGATTWNPSAVSTGPGHLIAFVRGTDKALWFREYINGAWTPFASVGGSLNSDPKAVSWGPGHVAVFVRGQAKDLWYRERNGSVWGPWIALGGSFNIDPQPVVRGPGLIDVFVQWTNATIARISFNGSAWGGWQTLWSPPNGSISDPAAVATTDGRLVVLARAASANGASTIYQKTSWDSGQTWTAWTQRAVQYPWAKASPVAVANPNGGYSYAASSADGQANGGFLLLFCTVDP